MFVLTEALLTEVAKVVFDSLLQQAMPKEQLRTWLGRDPQRLAFQVALARAYTTFAGNDAQWAASFFDAQFLKGRAAPLLARCLTRNGSPDPAELATAWMDQVGVQGEERGMRLAEVMPAASDFLRLLNAELRSRPEFQPLFDSQALDAISTNTERTTQVVEALRVDLIQALKEANTYQVTLNQSQGPVIGDHNVIIQHFTAGITTLFPDYATRIENFLVEYLGRPERPVPFGGREADLATLNAWLDDPQAPPYLLLAAPAGRGKSALLARWSQRLMAREDLAVAFLPVSIRFGTNLSRVFLAALSARLAKLHGESLSSSVGISADEWRGIVSSYLNRPLPGGHSLLLILDGVDEAVDWEAGPDLFPLLPPAGLRVVLSARFLTDTADPGAWLERLGWKRPGLARALTLAPLDPAGVADALRSMGFPLDSLESRVDIVTELYRLSEGDPLLVGLYAEDLWKRGDAASRLLPDDLPSIPPGLEGYFDNWWKEQRSLWGDKSPLREPTVQALLNLLACALGPLSQDDILQLEPGLSSWTLQEDLQPLARFVIGDGRPQGYVYSHFRLGAYFYDRLSVSERKAIESRFLKWGTQTVATLSEPQLRPEGISSYLKQYYGTHLYRAGEYNALFALVDNRTWYETQMASDASGATYLADLELTWSAAEEVDAKAVERSSTAPLLGREMHCALAIASMHSLSSSMKSELLTALVVSEVWQPSQALAMARQNPNPTGRAGALAALAPYLPIALMGEALVAARTIDDAGAKTSALAALFPYLAEPQKPTVLQEALATARAIDDAEGKASALAALFPYLTELEKPGVFQEVLATAHTIDNTDDDEQEKAQVLADTLEALAPYLPETLLGEALSAARGIDVVGLKAGALATLAPYLAEPQKLAVLQEALAAAQAINDQDDNSYDNNLHRTFALESLALYLPETLLDEALAAARIINGVGWKARALAALVVVPPIDQTNGKVNTREVLVEEALDAARAIDDTGWRARALASLAVRLPEPQKTAVLQEALTEVQMIADMRTKVLMLAKLVFYLPEPSKNPLLHTIFGAPGAIEATESVEEDEVERIEALAALLPHLEEPQKSAVLQEMKTSVQTIQHPCDRARALAVLVPHLEEPQRSALLKEIQEAVGKLKTEAERAEVLVMLVPRLEEPQKSAVLQDALNITRNIDEQFTATGKIKFDFDRYVVKLDRHSPFAGRRARPFAMLADELPEPQKTEVLREALDSVFGIPPYSGVLQAQELEALAPRLTETLVREVLAQVQAIESEAWRTNIFLALLIRLAELGYMQDALDVAHAFWGGTIPPEVQEVLMPDRAEPQQNTVLQEAPAVGQETGGEDEKNGSLSFTATVNVNGIVNIYSLTPTVGKPGSPLESVTLNSNAPQLSVADQREVEHRIAEAVLPGQISQMPEMLVREALNAVQAFKSGTEWLQAKAALLIHLAELGHAQHALNIAHVFWGEALPAMMQIMLLYYLAKPQQSAKLQEVVTATHTLQTKAERTAVLRALLLQRPVLSPPLYQLWHEALRLRATDGRRELLSDLPTLLPILGELGTSEVWSEMADAILDAATKWP